MTEIQIAHALAALKAERQAEQARLARRAKRWKVSALPQLRPQ